MRLANVPPTREGPAQELGVGIVRIFEQDVIVTTEHGLMPAFAACPDGVGPFPPIIFYMDAPGIREELRNMARRIAKQGYFCLLPDLYYRLEWSASIFLAAMMPCQGLFAPR